MARSPKIAAWGGSEILFLAGSLHGLAAQEAMAGERWAQVLSSTGSNHSREESTYTEQQAWQLFLCGTRPDS